MDTFYTRTSALQFATTLGHSDAATLVAAAEKILYFLAAAPVEVQGQGLGNTLGANPQSTQETASTPKRTRGKAATAAETSPATTAPAAQAVESAPATAAVTGDKETDDLFGDDPDPEVKEEKAKEVTMDDVRAKLVEVQTKFKHKDHALACLKHVSGGVILGGLKKEDYAKLVGVCTAALAKDAPPKF